MLSMETRTAKLVHMNPRTERHGEESVKAAAQPATGQQSSGAQNAQQRPATQAAAASGDLPYPAEALLKRLQSSADVDVLDADASLIAKYPLPVQKDLTAAYKARRAELTKD